MSLATGADLWHGAPDGGAPGLHDPIPIGHLVYAIDGEGLVALQGN